MVANRARNGADVSLGDHGDEAAPGARPSLSGNDMNLGSPEKLTFQPQMSSPEAINRFYRELDSARTSGTESDHPYLQHVPMGTV